MVQVVQQTLQDPQVAKDLRQLGTALAGAGTVPGVQAPLA